MEEEEETGIIHVYHPDRETEDHYIIDPAKGHRFVAVGREFTNHEGKRVTGLMFLSNETVRALTRVLDEKESNGTDR